MIGINGLYVASNGEEHGPIKVCKKGVRGVKNQKISPPITAAGSAHNCNNARGTRVIQDAPVVGLIVKKYQHEKLKGAF